MSKREDFSTLEERWYSNEVSTEEFFAELLHTSDPEIKAITDSYYFGEGDAEALAYEAFRLI